MADENGQNGNEIPKTLKGEDGTTYMKVPQNFPQTLEEKGLTLEGLIEQANRANPLAGLIHLEIGNMDGLDDAHGDNRAGFYRAVVDTFSSLTGAFYVQLNLNIPTP